MIPIKIGGEDADAIEDNLVEKLGLTTMSRGTVFKLGGMLGGTPGSVIQIASLLSGTMLRDMLGDVQETVDKITDNGEKGIFSTILTKNPIMSNRGSTYAGTKGVLSNISTSMSTLFSDTTSSSNTFLNNSNAVSASATNYTSPAATTSSKNVGDIYEALFINQLPVKTIISSIDSRVVESLANDSTYQVVDSQANAEFAEIKENVIRTKEFIESIKDKVTSPYGIGL